MLGFSLGGHLCLRLRAKTKALVEFFAPEFLEFGGLGSADNPTLHAQIHHGKEDEVVRFSPDAEHIATALKSEGASVDFLPAYLNAGHGFLTSVVHGIPMGGTDEGNARAHEESRKSTFAFFEAHL